jgi:hypothetical protein
MKARFLLAALWIQFIAQSQSYAVDCYTNNPRMMHVCALDDITAAFGSQGLFGLTVAGLVFVGGYFVTDGDIVVPGVMLMLVGGILVPGLPAQYQTLALTLMFAGGVGAVMQLLGKYVFGPSVT